MIVLVSSHTRQWWVRLDRDFYYRTRRDALHARNGISGLQMILRGRR